MDAETMERQVETLDLNALVEYSPERRVRKPLFQSDIIVSELVCYEPGQITKQHIHPYQDEIFYGVQGEGMVTFADREDVPIGPGTMVFVPAGVRHGIEAADSRLVITFTKGPGLPNPHRQRKKKQEA